LVSVTASPVTGEATASAAARSGLQIPSAVR
jgi:hypothetical protein